MGKVENLPKWAQHQIDKLEKDVRYYKRKIDEMSGEGGHETNTKLWDIDESMGLPNDARVQFAIEGGTIDVKVKRGELSLYSDRGVLAFVPSSSNMGKVRIVEW